VKRFAVLIAALALCACSKNIQNSQAVHDGVMDYLNAKAAQTGLDMNAMQVDVATVSFEKDKAYATISIKPKNLPNAAMQISYTLDRKGDKWVVRPDSGSQHAGAEGAPNGSASGRLGIGRRPSGRSSGGPSHCQSECSGRSSSLRAAASRSSSGRR
jgi:hypothetical protein